VVKDYINHIIFQNMNIKLNKWMLGAAALILGFTAVSCEDEPDKFELTSGVPVVKFIRMTDPQSADSLVTGAYMASTICLVGDNLTSIREMYFNDQKATLNTSYITKNTLVVDVPKNIPEVVTDKIYMITSSNDTVTYDFNVKIPAPTVSSMTCEWAKPGEEVTIYGRYFIDDPSKRLTVIFPDGSKISGDDLIAFTQTSVTVKVPEGCTEEGFMYVQSIYGKGRSVFHFHETRGMLFDFDGRTGLDFANNCWHAKAAQPADETSVDGAYIQFGDGKTVMTATGGWNDSQFAAEYWPGDWNNSYPASGQGMLLTDLVNFSDYENMAIKFEMMIPSSNPWSAGAMQIIPAAKEYVSLFSANNDYFHLDNDKLPRAWYAPWTATGSYDTGGKWITVTFPITSFVYYWDGTVTDVKINANSFNSLLIFIVNGQEGKECTPIIKVDNIRAVAI
jgi:hypothetical protein